MNPDQQMRLDCLVRAVGIASLDKWDLSSQDDIVRFADSFYQFVHDGKAPPDSSAKA